MPMQISFAHQFEQQRQETEYIFFSGDGKRLFSLNSSTFLWQLKEDGGWEYEGVLPADANVLSFDTEFLYYVEAKLIKLVSFDGSEIVAIPLPLSHSWVFSPDRRWLVSEQGGMFQVDDLGTQEYFSVPIPFSPLVHAKRNIDPSKERVGAFFFTPDSQQVILFSDSPEGSLHICLFDPEHKRIALQKTLPHGMIDGSISPDGKMFACIVPNDRPFDYL